MRLTKQSNYAVRTLMYCAVNELALSRIADIARVYHISEPFLFKLIKPLVDNGVLETVRGRHGGLRLGRPADQITLLQVIQVTEDSFALAECFASAGTRCPLVGACGYNMALNEALNAFLTTLDRYTIADLVSKRTVIVSRLKLPVL